ncbi:hypothetical protein JVT61DRAFT_14851 [Boletus reticuloceps]|uniref:Uncharacterized protein n=1 Tax=Boletus reticuloceps TaxID=495285 RepID=A0A8I3A2H2_9AGAM|nr:hypothetical protein JVT61DRAFT_14851 [Boletus reticuloceps]
MQEVFVFKERCKVLDAQLLKVTTERDTLKMMFEKLSTSLQNPTTVPSSSSVTMMKNAKSYPKLHFWSQSTYNTWTNSAEAHSDTRYKFAFIEDKEGNVVTEGTLKAICKTIQGCWAELVIKGMALKSWGKAKASAKDVVYSLAYKSFPFLQLAENNWKIDLLCSLNYPGWVHNNLDDKGNWVASRRIKQEDEAAAGDEPAVSVSKKCKAKPVKSEPSEKQFKGE